ncbi:Uncharacterized protein APZ42_020428 [Daphnia magna]|uniref:Uncharacterized protein n=1 Tax=Daphnia magna TaxID=35525 RepID=A0A164XGU3_9CRUS|nr:Uncharacterized protein APZ42_020428 [Daphnia magna]
MLCRLFILFLTLLSTIQLLSYLCRRLRFHHFSFTFFHLSLTICTGFSVLCP